MKFKVKTKIFPFFNPAVYDKPFIVGYAGDLSAVGDVLEFLGDPLCQTKPPRTHKGTEYIVLTEDSKIFTFFNPTKWILVDEDCYSIGSGSHFAMGALKNGATPKQAVKAAMNLDPNTGFGVKEIKIK